MRAQVTSPRVKSTGNVCGRLLMTSHARSSKVVVRLQQRRYSLSEGLMETPTCVSRSWQVQTKSTRVSPEGQPKRIRCRLHPDAACMRERERSPVRGSREAGAQDCTASRSVPSGFGRTSHNVAALRASTESFCASFSSRGKGTVER